MVKTVAIVAPTAASTLPPSATVILGVLVAAAGVFALIDPRAGVTRYFEEIFRQRAEFDVHLWGRRNSDPRPKQIALVRLAFGVAGVTAGVAMVGVGVAHVL